MVTMLFNFLCKQSELTSLLIQHNQSPDTRIFALHSSKSSKMKQTDREGKKLVRDQVVLDMGEKTEKIKDKQKKVWQRARGTIESSHIKK